MFDRITLEINPGLFYGTDETLTESSCRAIFTAWQPLLMNRKTISVLLKTTGSGGIPEQEKPELARRAESLIKKVGSALYPDAEVTALYAEEPPGASENVLSREYGAELAGYMSRICALPGRAFPFRCNVLSTGASQLCLTLAVSRVAPDGSLETADSLSMAAAGTVSDEDAASFTARLLDAEKDMPDLPGPIVWVYPASEYSGSSDTSALQSQRDGDRFIADCISGGLPLSCVISTDCIEQLILLKGCIFICPEHIAEQVRRLAGMNGVISYSGTDSTAQDMLWALARTGYSIKFHRKQNASTPVLAFVPHDNGFMFSARNADTETETVLRFPQGAPIMTGSGCMATPDGTAYQFSPDAHHECRVFVMQIGGPLSAREVQPVRGKYHRIIAVSGLNDAFVRFYPEKAGCREAVALRPDIPEPDSGWRFAEDEMGLTYMYRAHVSGDIEFCMV